MTAKLTPQEFVEKWRKVTLNERATYQSHFIDLCAMLGHPAPTDLDKTGQEFCFEKGASKQAGGEGFADVWYRGHFAWEYKGRHANLDKAYQQLCQYREALENPPLLIVCDLDTIQIHTNFTNTVKRVFSLKLDDLLTAQGLDTLRSVFHNPEALKSAQSIENVTAQAAARFALIADRLRAAGHPAQESAHFLIRLLFCLFAEDVKLLPERILTRLVQSFRNRPGTFQAQLQLLFAAMSTGGAFGMENIPYFDGHLFDDAQALPLDAESLDILLQVSGLDWSSIEPSIFGTLFERSLDPSKRSQLGAHYTGREDILLIIEPVLMAPLRRKWQAVQAQARALAEKRDAAPRGKAREKAERDLQTCLMGFADEIAAVQVLDPACGSGNFLYLALRELLNLQKEVRQAAGELGLGYFFPSVSPAQLHGIEINEYAHQLAQTSIQIGFIQWLGENGFGAPPEPILQPLDNIQRMDAILAYDADGKPVEPAWPAADVIISNPPFLGSIKQKSSLGEDYLNDVISIYGTFVPPKSDFVCYWFEKARKAILNGNAKRVGLIATQAIRKGMSRKVLDEISHTASIFMAYSDKEWTVDGAAVRVSIVCFDNGSEKDLQLNGTPVSNINPDLSALADVTLAKPLPENRGIAFPGTKKYGSFDITGDVAKQMLADQGNPNSKPNSDVVKPWVNGSDLVGIRRKMWIIDFGVDMPEEAAAKYEMPFEYLRKHVKPERDKERITKTREIWWLFERPRPDMRMAIASLKRFIGTPVVSKHRIFVFLDGMTIPDAKVTVFARDDDYFFGVLHSRIHEVWSLRNGSRHGDGNEGGRPTYNINAIFDTFSYPWPPGKEDPADPRVQAIAAAAAELNQLRQNWLNPAGASEAELKKRTLTNLYNQRPTWLAQAHRKLDEAVFAAYGWPAGLSDEEILSRLLALNLERAENLKVEI